VSSLVLEICGVSKGYRGLRPLRIQHLSVGTPAAVAVVGLDLAASEVLVNLITGAMLPDAGTIRLFGRPTSAIADSAEWLAVIDRVGIVSARAVLLERLSITQNLAMPFTLDIEPPAEEVRVRAEALAAEVGLPPSAWPAAVANGDASVHARVRLARALALGPALLLLDHASADLSRDDVDRFGRDVRAIGQRRGLAIVAATADDRFADAVADRVLVLEAATGRLVERRRGWFGRRLG
jgi:ABC-type transporter Mla maintaining outer membrane lipid asymmetry ATPase subunit MlaF